MWLRQLIDILYRNHPRTPPMSTLQDLYNDAAGSDSTVAKDNDSISADQAKLVADQATLAADVPVQATKHATLAGGIKLVSPTGVAVVTNPDGSFTVLVSDGATYTATAAVGLNTPLPEPAPPEPPAA